MADTLRIDNTTADIYNSERRFASTDKVARIEERCTEVEVGMTGGAGTVTVVAAIPAGAYDVVVTAKITTIIVLGGGGATWSLGTTDADRFAAGKALTVGVTVTPADYASDNAFFDVYQAATDLVFTANAGTFTSGVVRLTVFYKLVTVFNAAGL